MIYILLPVYNEEKNIGAVLQDIAAVLLDMKQEFFFVIVNDGSTDKTADILREYSLKFALEIINFQANKGVGEVFKVGIKRICEIAKGDDFLFSLDCDRTHPAKTFRGMFRALEEGKDLVIASRYHLESKTIGLPMMRKFLSDGINHFLKKIFPVAGGRDYTTFFRAYRVSVLKRALILFGGNFIQSKGFACMCEILIKISVLNPKIEEVPIELNFNLRQGKSKMRIFKTVFEYLVLIPKLKRYFGRFSKRR